MTSGPARKFRGRKGVLKGSLGPLTPNYRPTQSHHVRIPQLVDVAIVTHGELAVGPAYPVARAVVGAGCALARRPLVADEARTRRGCSVAQALVGALHVVVRGVLEAGVLGSVCQLFRLLSSFRLKSMARNTTTERETF